MWKSYVESLEAGRAGNGMEAAGSGGGIFGLLRTISYFTYEMVDRQGKSPRRAILGNAGQDARCFRPVRFETLTPFH